MRHYGYPEKIVRILANAYKDTFSAVRVNGELSEWFETVMGVLHGCVFSPLLFNIFLEMIMAMALDKSNEGADIGGERIGDLRFADGIALLAEQEKGLQKTLTCRSRTGEPKNGHEDKHTGDRMPITGRRKQEVSPGGGRTGIGANGELCVSGRKYQHTRGV